MDRFKTLLIYYSYRPPHVVKIWKRSIYKQKCYRNKTIFIMFISGQNPSPFTDLSTKPMLFSKNKTFFVCGLILIHVQFWHYLGEYQTRQYAKLYSKICNVRGFINKYVGMNFKRSRLYLTIRTSDCEHDCIVPYHTKNILWTFHFDWCIFFLQKPRAKMSQYRYIPIWVQI